MRVASLAVLLCAVGCGPGSPLVGTWHYELDTVIQTATGPATKKVTFDLDLTSTAASDLVDWKLGGGCNVGLGVVGKVASFAAAADAPLCGLAANAQVLLVGETGTMVKAGDQLGVNVARFEVLDDGHLSTSFDYKLYTDLRDARIGPVFTVVTGPGTHGTRRK